MPRAVVVKNCVGCNLPYEANPDLSTESMDARLRRATIIAIMAIIVALVAAAFIPVLTPSSSPLRNQYETTGTGIVRFADGKRVIHENAYGFVKVLDPLCSNQGGVWTNMQARVNFKWVAWANPFTTGVITGQCYNIVGVQRTGPDIPNK